MNQHDNESATTDIGIVRTREGFEKFRERFLGLGYRPAFPDAGRTFRDTEDQVKIDVLIKGGFPSDGKRKPVIFPDPRTR